MAKKTELQAVNPHEVNHVSGACVITSGIYDFWADAPCVFALSPVRNTDLFAYETQSFSVAFSGNPRRFHVPCDSALAVEVSQAGSWQVKPLKRVELDSTPIEIPLHLSRPLTLEQELKRFIRESMHQVRDDDPDTFDEADDLDVEDFDEAPDTRYTVLDQDDFGDNHYNPDKVAGESGSQQGSSSPSGSNQAEQPAQSQSPAPSNGK